ncbi:unnamed protein product [Penicillium salamii]|nr:unnamed protein product [Penicillium salamii]CAG8202561.1 unnamed protein product [Penicillium salamii]CAG8392027.1 unnamed protein product [Penicillium salamii]
MSNIRFSKIGMIIQNDDGSYDVDAIPGLGGPFETAAEYFTAWCKTVKFPTRETDIRARLPYHLQDEMLESIEKFPDQIQESLHKFLVKNEGPFPLYHRDFRHSNVIIDNNYNILSIIDWDNAGTVPWEIVEFPLFLDVIPPPMDMPGNYDAKGNPVDEETRNLWNERNDYVQGVMKDEKETGSDGSLSSILSSRYNQNIATALRLYEESVKIGHYCKVLDEIGHT